jgi:hypothetical protein
MHEDPTLFGAGRYPDGGPLAVLSRLAFLAATAGVVIAVFLPPDMVPRFAHSHYLEHFASFYVLVLAGLAAMQRARLRRVAMGFLIFATGLEASNLAAGAPFAPLLRNWVADIGGTSAAIAPIVVERFRRRFPKTPAGRAA